jgi:hypothetical protein
MATPSSSIAPRIATSVWTDEGKPDISESWDIVAIALQFSRILARIGELNLPCNWFKLLLINKSNVDIETGKELTVSSG